MLAGFEQRRVMRHYPRKQRRPAVRLRIYAQERSDVRRGRIGINVVKMGNTGSRRAPGLAITFEAITLPRTQGPRPHW